MKYLNITLIIFCISLKTTYAQLKSATPALYVDSGIVLWDYHSKVINEDYTIYVNVPSGYDTTKTDYPVLYLTDGDWNVITAMDCFSMLEQDYETTDPIIVGIGYGQKTNMRSRDLDPSTGGPKFLSFIQNEVMPFINSKYRVNGNNALYGYSYGGMFTTSVLFDHPGLFKTIFIGAPGNSGRDLLPAAQKYFKNHTDLNSKVFAGIGSYEPETANNVIRFKTYMLNQNCKNLDLGTVIIPNTAHGATIAPFMQAAMKFAYCKTHKEINLTAKQLEKYTGNYRFPGMPKVKFKTFLKGNKLYFEQDTNVPLRFVPFAKDQFFTYESEKGEFDFKEEGGKQQLLYIQSDRQPQRLDKIN